MNGYRSIFETLRREVLGGKYDATKVLPSEWTLSRRFGVCRPTVSRAVLEMEREGFVVRRQGASTMLTRFAKNASGTIGIVVQGEWNYEDLYPSILRKLMSTAERSGWQVVRCDIEPSRGRARVKAIREIVERLTREHVTGVFLQPIECMRESARFNAEIVARLKTANIHTVLLDYDIVQLPLRSDCDLVGVDNFAAGYALGRHMYERGARRIAFHFRRFAAPSVADRLRGMAAALQEAGVNWRMSENVITCESDSRTEIADFMRRRRPDAIVAYNDKSALELMRTLSQMGFDVPEDMMIAGFDDIPAAVASNPTLTTMAQPVDDIASIAFNTLVSRIKSPDLPPRKTILPCRLMPRRSTDTFCLHH